MSFYDSFPDTRYYDTELWWIIKRIRKLMELMHAIICQLRKWADLIAQWQDQMDEWAERMDEFERRLDEFERRLDEYEKRLEIVEEWLKNLQEQVDKNTQDIADLQKEVENIYNLITEMREDITNIQNDIKNIFEQLVIIDERLENIDNHLEIIDNHLTTIDNTLIQIGEQITEINNTIDTIIQTINEIHLAIQNITNVIENHEDRITELENRPPPAASRILILGKGRDIEVDKTGGGLLAAPSIQTSFICQGKGGTTVDVLTATHFEISRVIWRACDVIHIRIFVSISMSAATEAATRTIKKGSSISGQLELGLYEEYAHIFMPMFSANDFIQKSNVAFCMTEMGVLDVTHTLVPIYSDTEKTIKYNFYAQFLNDSTQSFPAGQFNRTQLVSGFVDFELPAQYKLTDDTFPYFDNTTVLSDNGWIVDDQQPIEDVPYNGAKMILSDIRATWAT